MNFKTAVNKKNPTDIKLIDYNKKNPNYNILESTKNCEGNWQKYEKNGGVWAVKLTEKTLVKSLENRNGLITGKKGEWLLMGEDKSEKWFMSSEEFKTKYNLLDEDIIRLDEENRKYSWYEKIPGEPVLAIKMYKPFKIIHERSNEPLIGKTGDYIVKHYSDINNPDPKDVWIVDEKIFEDTYKEVL